MGILPVKVKLFGASFKIHSLQIKEDYLKRFHEVSVQLGEPLEEALLNINFFYELKLKGFNSIQDLPKNTFGGMENNSKGHIEIWQGRKVLQKLKLADLFYSNTLFPLFNVQLDRINLGLQNNIFLIEKEVGLIGQYEVDLTTFDIYKLKFFICEAFYLNTNYQLLLSINYDGKPLKIIKSDTLLTYQHCVSFIQ